MAGKAAAIGLLLVAIVACEAPLRLEQVEAAKLEPIRRSDLFQAAASNDAAVVVVGNQGLVIRSENGGAQWSRQTLPNWPGLIDVEACPNGRFAALGFENQVWMSEDNGVTWTPKRFESQEEMQGLTCDPENRLWVVGSYSTILSSEDGGDTWKTFTTEEDTIFTNIQFLDTQNAYVTGEFGVVFKTKDGGASWEALEMLPDEFYAQASYFRDVNEGWIIGLGGAIWHTTDGGQSWQLQESATIAPLYGITPAGDELYAVGGEGVILRLNGARWERLDHKQTIRLFLRAVLPVGSDKLLIGGRSGVLHVLARDTLSVITGLKAGETQS